MTKAIHAVGDTLVVAILLVGEAVEGAAFEEVVLDEAGAVAFLFGGEGAEVGFFVVWWMS